MSMIRWSIHSVVGLILIGLAGASTETIADDFPANAVIFTLASTCPSGYAVNADIAGRFIVATPADGSEGWTHGTAFTDKQSLPSHTHSIHESTRYGRGSRTANRASKTKGPNGDWLPFIYLTACVKQ